MCLAGFPFLCDLVGNHPAARGGHHERGKHGFRVVLGHARLDVRRDCVATVVVPVLVDVATGPASEAIVAATTAAAVWVDFTVPLCCWGRTELVGAPCQRAWGLVEWFVSASPDTRLD